MASSYKVFLKITTSHDYYVSGSAVDLSFVPTKATAELMKNRRLKFNGVEGGFVLAFQSLDGTNPLIDYEGISLDFVMLLDNAVEFFNFTNLNAAGTYTARKKLHFTNSPQATKKVDYSLIDEISPKVFTFLSPLTTNDPDNETLTLELENLDSGEKTLLEDQHAKPDGTFEIPIDLSKKNGGRYAFKSTTNPGNATETLQLLIDEELDKTPLFGMVTLKLEASTLSEYELVFERRQSLWSYILVNRSNRNDFASLLVKDNSLLNEPPYDSYSFQKIGPEFTVGDKTAVKFRSTGNIPTYELPKKDIEVVKEIDGNDLVLIKNLANPPIDRMSSSQSESDIYVFV